MIAIQTSSQAELLTFFPSSSTLLLVVWSANGNATVVLFTSPRLVPIHLMMTLTYAFVRVIVSSIQTNRVRCALYFFKSGISGARSGRVSL